MADEEQLRLLKEQGVEAWNNLRETDLYEANLPEANLRGANLSGAYLRGANLKRANLELANLTRANLRETDLYEANLSGANLRGAYLYGAYFRDANLWGANLTWAYLPEANFSGANLRGANLTGANLRGAYLNEANLNEANLTGANLRGAYLNEANLTRADLRGADLRGANLRGANLNETDLGDADLTGCHIFGVSAWRLTLSEGTKQQNLVITNFGEPQITADNIEVAQFLYLLMHNEKLQSVIDTIGKKGVLLLGRFTEGRIAVLERLREELRKRDFLPIVFNFDKPETKNFTETVRLLAGMSRFVIADITNPRSAPLELQATVPECMVPFIPIQDKNEEEKPFAMLRDLQIAHPDRVLAVIRYPSVGRLIEVLDTEIITPAQEMFADLLARKAAELRVRDI
jgi:uncharacterized protein YjbI with pentapeptide repeats